MSKLRLTTSAVINGSQESQGPPPWPGSAQGGDFRGGGFHGGDNGFVGGYGNGDGYGYGNGGGYGNRGGYGNGGDKGYGDWYGISSGHKECPLFSKRVMTPDGWRVQMVPIC